jgi:hypothetical protein
MTQTHAENQREMTQNPTVASSRICLRRIRLKMQGKASRLEEDCQTVSHQSYSHLLHENQEEESNLFDDSERSLWLGSSLASVTF